MLEIVQPTGTATSHFEDAQHIFKHQCSQHVKILMGDSGGRDLVGEWGWRKMGWTPTYSSGNYLICPLNRLGNVF